MNYHNEEDDLAQGQGQGLPPGADDFHKCDSATASKILEALLERPHNHPLQILWPQRPKTEE